MIKYFCDLCGEESPDGLRKDMFCSYHCENDFIAKEKEKAIAKIHYFSNLICLEHRQKFIDPFTELVENDYIDFFDINQADLMIKASDIFLEMLENGVLSK